MTRKEAIKILSELAGYEKTMDLIQNYSVSVQDALHIAINSLMIDERYELEYEQAEPCEDAINRQAAIEVISKYDFSFPEYMERFVVELRDAMKADLVDDIKSLPPVQPISRWIPVSERLPEGDETVIASTEYGVYPEARYTKKYGWEWAYESGTEYWVNLECVTAWMPLPEPYKGENEEE